jgi:hypothetical protein
MAEHGKYPAFLVVIDQDIDASTPNGGLVLGTPLLAWHHRVFSFQVFWTAHGTSGLLTLDADIKLNLSNEYANESRQRMIALARFTPYTDEQFLRFFTTAGDADGVSAGRPKNPGPGNSYFEREFGGGAFRVDVQRNSGSGHVKVVAVAKD